MLGVGWVILVRPVNRGELKSRDVLGDYAGQGRMRPDLHVSKTLVSTTALKTIVFLGCLARVDGYLLWGGGNWFGSFSFTISALAVWNWWLECWLYVGFHSVIFWYYTWIWFSKGASILIFVVYPMVRRAHWAHVVILTAALAVNRFWGIVVLLWVCQAFRIRSALNGNNGEWTNSDDTDPAERIRINREANTNRFRKAPKGKPKAETRPCRDVPCTNPQCKFIHPTVENIPIVEVPVDEVSDPLPEGTVHKGFFYTKKLEILPIPDSFMDDKTINSTYVKSFDFGGIRFIGGKKLVWEALVYDLRVKYPSPVSLEKNYSALLRYVVKSFPKADLTLLEETGHAFLCDMMELSSPVAGYSSVSYSARKMYVSLCGSPEPSIIYGVICEKKNEWTFNRRWGIKLNKAVFTWEGDRIKTYPTFKFEEARQKYFVTCYARIEGRLSFQYFDICAKNCTGALSRILKGRPQEDLFHKNQMNLCLVDKDLAGEMLRMAGGKLTWEDYVWVVRPREVNGFKEEIFLVEDVDSTTLFKAILPPAPILWWLLTLWPYVQAWVAGVKLLTELCKLGGLTSWIDALVENYYEMGSTHQVVIAAGLPSPKAALYTMWALDDKKRAFVENEEFEEWEMNLKREIGKYGKFGRTYGSGGAMTLYDRIIAGVLKILFSREVQLHKWFPSRNGKNITHTMRYWEANSPSESDRMYKTIIARLATGTDFYTVAFSDDGFTFGKNLKVETDIVGADSAARLGIFVWIMSFVKIFTSLTHALKLIKPLCCRARLVNPDGEGYMLFTPQTYALQSGSFITTAVNTAGVFLITLGTFRLLQAGVDLKEASLRGAERYGYVLEADYRSSYNNCTFLKRAFCVECQRSWLVYGPILRSIGMVEGTPTPESFGLQRKDNLSNYTPAQLLLKLLISRVYQLQYEPNSCIINAIRRAAGMDPEPEILPIESLIDRYGFSHPELMQMCDDIAKMTVGSVICGEAVGKIYLRDYGVEDVDFDGGAYRIVD